VLDGGARDRPTGRPAAPFRTTKLETRICQRVRSTRHGSIACPHGLPSHRRATPPDQSHATSPCARETGPFKRRRKASTPRMLALRLLLPPAPIAPLAPGRSAKMLARVRLGRAGTAGSRATGAACSWSSGAAVPSLSGPHAHVAAGCRTNDGSAQPTRSCPARGLRTEPGEPIRGCRAAIRCRSPTAAACSCGASSVARPLSMV